MMNFESYISAIKTGRSYVSEGSSHIINFAVNGQESGMHNSELSLKGQETVKINASVAAYLPVKQNEAGAEISKRRIDEQPYWNIERARIGTSRKVKVELIVNGRPVDATEIVADGKMKDISFSYPVKRSSWMALRVYPSSHTNPVFVWVDGKPVHEKESAIWCRKAVDQCWKMKQSKIRIEERPAAEAAYNKARSIYDNIIQESGN
jgi:hypothetical protein